MTGSCCPCVAVASCVSKHAAAAVAAATRDADSSTVAAAAVVAAAAAQQVAVMRLAETAEGWALLGNLRALQLLPAELPQGAELQL
uniref:Uncharacterized protein n=1 Tax=Tetradesmus obliquus TaxID=3088 RepID=A0A383WLG6_TETOB